MFKTWVGKYDRVVYMLAVLSVSAAALLFAASNTTVADAQIKGDVSPEGAGTNFPGTGVGAIPDATACGPTPGTPLNITFNVTGISGPPSNVSVNFTSGTPSHTWIGDIRATLIAPNGASHSIFGVTGSTTATGIGNGNNLVPGNIYSYNNAATSSWWTTAIANVNIPAGNYRTSNPGGAGATNPMPATDMNAAFAGIPTSNGTWTLRFTDGCDADTGAISAANLTLTGAAPPPAQNVIDFDGNGRTDFAVVRNTGGGGSGQVTWFYALNGAAGVVGSAWGIASDFFTPADFDGDNKTDIVVWRSGAAGVAGFYILQSATQTFRFEQFGQTGDDPSVVGDYDNDGKADPAVYRGGAVSGDPSTWFYRGSNANPGGNVTYVPWGQNGDFPAPGDYDGDGRNDFVIQRNNGGGQARFWMAQTTAGQTSIVFGTPTDVIVPGDYDGDGKTDIATIRGSGVQIFWFVRPSSTGAISGGPTYIWGNSATDFPSQGDYDGDGKTDPAIWRPSATANASAFWFFGSTAGAGSFAFGANGDYPVANYNVH